MDEQETKVTPEENAPAEETEGTDGGSTPEEGTPAETPAEPTEGV